MILHIYIYFVRNHRDNRGIQKKQQTRTIMIAGISELQSVNNLCKCKTNNKKSLKKVYVGNGSFLLEFSFQGCTSKTNLG